MKRNWSPPTACDMVCPHCHAKLPRGTRHHDCATSTREVVGYELHDGKLYYGLRRVPVNA